MKRYSLCRQKPTLVIFDVAGKKIIYTIGHSTRTEEGFVAMLASFNIRLLADIRSYPGSKKFPHFNKENLQRILPEHGMQYCHIPELGGRRKALKDSKNAAWRNDAFRGYADYMGSEGFKSGIEKLESEAQKRITAFMCSEAVWWRCHRSLVSDYLKWKGWTVLHIMNEKKSEEHPYTSPADIVNGQLSYHGKSEQSTLF
jgi:uncharacterized protein (DUF488 family)